MDRKRSWLVYRCYPGTCTKWLRKHTKLLSGARKLDRVNICPPVWNKKDRFWRNLIWQMQNETCGARVIFVQILLRPLSNLWTVLPTLATVCATSHILEQNQRAWWRNTTKRARYFGQEPKYGVWLAVARNSSNQTSLFFFFFSLL
jgi:hypothetical protein